MNTHTCIVIGLVAFDLLLLTRFYFYLRSHAPVGRRALFSVAAGLLGFAIQALLCFRGALLYVQLATIAGIFSLYFLVSAAPRKEQTRAATEGL
ncbi:MAG TPA: hypothetical protein VNT26_02285 [Candidatus Sulfotelmatobacter sp.]|nr:hypothetical protein [Candidatus Sulfotelmatobacter sp.]